jgi:hypothetical protein
MIEDPNLEMMPSIAHHGVETSMVLEELPENEYDDSQRGDNGK